MLEKAISLTPIDKIDIKLLKKFDRVYIGSNFCSNLLPEIKDIERLKDYGITKITITTPFLAETGLKKAIIIIKKAAKLISPIEVSTNDIGLLNKLKNINGINLLLARPVSHDWLRMKIPVIKKFIKEFNIKYIETDEKSMIKRLSKTNIKFTFHYPFEYLSMSRICPFEKRIISSCFYKCINENIVKLNEEGTKDIIYLKNNVYFKKNKLIYSKNIKRAVVLYYGQKF